jgi:hypothetical protein
MSTGDVLVSRAANQQQMSLDRKDRPTHTTDLTVERMRVANSDRDKEGCSLQTLKGTETNWTLLHLQCHAVSRPRPSPAHPPPHTHCRRARWAPVQTARTCCGVRCGPLRLHAPCCHAPHGAPLVGSTSLPTAPEVEHAWQQGRTSDRQMAGNQYNLSCCSCDGIWHKKTGMSSEALLLVEQLAGHHFPDRAKAAQPQNPEPYLALTCTSAAGLAPSFALYMSAN